MNDAFQLPFTPGVCLTLVETKPGKALHIGASTWMDRGIAFGIPIHHAQLSPATADFLLSSLAHEYSEALLIFPDVLDCRLYRNSRYNRWVGDGLAELVTTLARRRAQQSGFPIPRQEQDLQILRDLLSAGQQTVDLSIWAAQDRDSPSPGLVIEQSVAHYAAAEYLCWLWYQRALEKSEAPIADLVAWMHGRPPSKKELVAWMQRSSGLNIESMLDAISLQDTLVYQESKLIQ
jgi:hypothetical protein